MSVRFDDGGDHLLRTSGIAPYNGTYTAMWGGSPGDPIVHVLQVDIGA